MFKNRIHKNGQYLGRVVLTLLLAALLGVAGCDEKSPSADEVKKENKAAQEIIRKIEEPKEKVRELEKQLLERDERNKKLADQM